MTKAAGVFALSCCAALVLPLGCGSVSPGGGGGGSTGSAGATGGAARTGTAGATGSAGTTGNAGTTGSAGTTGGAGTTGTAGTTGSAGTTGTAGTTGSAGRGGNGGAGHGGSGATGGAGHGGTGGGGGASQCQPGQVWCPGCTPGTGTCSSGGCPGVACPPPDSGVPPVVCTLLTTLADCDARSDCHAVFVDPGTCRCAAVGCCAQFSRCADGGTADCKGPATCEVATPHCVGPAYVVAYANACYEGCVRATACAP